MKNERRKTSVLAAMLAIHLTVAGTLHAQEPASLPQSPGVKFPAPRNLPTNTCNPVANVSAWAGTVASDDTRVTVGATAEGQLCVYELGNPSDGWNWTRTPSVFPFVRQAVVGKETRELHWSFKDGRVTNSAGQTAELCFTNESPALELRSIWSAKPGRGPVRHLLRLVNRSDQPVTFRPPPWMLLELAGPSADVALTLWTFHTDGATPDRQGVYREALRGAGRTIETNPEKGRFIPLAVLDGEGKRGVYVGIEWSMCWLKANVPDNRPTGSARVQGGEREGFTVTIAPGETYETPASLVGAYRGDVDDAGNSLRRYLFNHSMPEIVRTDASYPKVQWNVCGATADKLGSWNCVERKFYPAIDAIAPLGFEEAMIDVGWWNGPTQASEPVSDPVDWPSGMAKAAEYAHTAGMRFGLYWNKGEDMSKPEGRNRRMAHVKRLYEEYHADMWRSDNTAGIVIGETYAQVRGFYAMLDQLAAEIPGFQWENCCSGGRIKDFGAMRRAVKVFITDTYSELHVRQAFYDSSYALPPAQLMGCVGSTDGKFRPQGAAGVRFAFRSTSMGAPEWFIDAPNGATCGAPWTNDEKAALKAAVATYKTKIRPLVRTADLYHILPRPDGRNWDGVQYYDPATRKGVVYLFKPAPAADTVTLKLRGLDPAVRYSIAFADESNPPQERTGAELANGFAVSLKGAPVSELIFLKQAAELPANRQDR